MTIHEGVGTAVGTGSATGKASAIRGSESISYWLTMLALFLSIEASIIQMMPFATADRPWLAWINLPLFCIVAVGTIFLFLNGTFFNQLVRLKVWLETRAW